MNNKKITISIIIVLVISVISLGVAFAAFSTTLNINGSAAIEATSWDIFFTTEDDGAKPTQETVVPAANIDPHGTATNNSATILATTFNWNANFKSPGDKIIYTIYVKNGGNYNAQVSGINTPQISCSNDTKNACDELSYGLYTDTVGNTPLSTSFTVNAGATEVFYLIATLSENYGGNGSGLVTSDITTSTISATVTFEQVGSATSNNSNSGGNGGGSIPSGDPFMNTDGAYYTYEGKSFIGTGVDNVILSEDVIGEAKFATLACSDGTEYSAIKDEVEDFPANRKCDSGAEYIFTSFPARNMAASYCTGCRLMTLEEAVTWAGCDLSDVDSWSCINPKMCIKYETYNFCKEWWFNDIDYIGAAWASDYRTAITSDNIIDKEGDVRPVVSIPSGATMTGSGTQGSPYVIAVSN